MRQEAHFIAFPMIWIQMGYVYDETNAESVTHKHEITVNRIRVPKMLVVSQRCGSNALREMPYD